MEAESGPISIGEFGVAFKGFLEQAAAQAPLEEPFFVRRLNEHFGTQAQTLPVVAQPDGRDGRGLRRRLSAHDQPA